jgi:poly(A) polymerase
MTKPAPGLRIDPPRWAAEPATRSVVAALAAGGAAPRFVGGAVRDALLGLAEPRTDIDIATPAPPERVIELLRRAQIKTVPTGLAHGTVTAVVPPRHFEITTLRRDVETFGRRARVAFDADWTADAARRDFTINAIYLDPDGLVHDPMGGIADLRARRVRFVGDPETRIAEDVLRILRYYRFEARFGTGAGDPAARAACRTAVALLPSLSAERVAQELVKLLEARDPLAALGMMAEDGVLAAVLPEARRPERLRRLIAVAPEADPMLRLAALVETDAEGAAALARRLRLSNAWRERLCGLVPPWPLDPGADRPAQLHALYRLGAERYRDLVLLRAAAGETDAGRLAELLDFARHTPVPVFPLRGRDVTRLGVPPGERVGRLLNAVQHWWEDGDFAAERAQCLARLRRLTRTESNPAATTDPGK